MNKQELIGAVADATGLSRGDATRAVEGVFDTIQNALKRGDEVRLVGFGTFSCSKRKASTGRNPVALRAYARSEASRTAIGPPTANDATSPVIVSSRSSSD